MNDPLAWLKTKSEETLSFLKEQNAITDEFLKPTLKLQETIFHEILNKIQQNDQSYPHQDKSYFYYHQTIKGMDHELIFRCDDVDGQNAQLILDINQLTKQQPYTHLGQYRISPDENILAYTMDHKGDEYYSLFLKNIKTFETIQTPLKQIDAHFVFSLDQQSIYYMKMDQTHRPYQVYRHDLNAKQNQDVLLYEEKDPMFHLSLDQSKDKNYLLIKSKSKNSSEVYALNLNQKDHALAPLFLREENLIYDIESHQDNWIILNNFNGAKHFKISTCPKSDVSRLLDLIAPHLSQRFDHIEVFKNHMAIFYRERGLTQLDVYRFNDHTRTCIHFDEAAYYLNPSHNEVYDSNMLLINYESPITPDSIIQINLQSLDQTVVKQDRIPSGFDPNQYILSFFEVSGHDQEKIPVTLLEPRNIKTQAILIKGYGAYEISSEPYFHRSHFSLLDRGFAVATAHIRGGGEKGRTWYEMGKLHNKMNSFKDFISVAKHFVQTKKVLENKISIMGGSAGGLLMGAVTNMEPELFRSVVALVPFVDVYNTMLDESLPLTITEFEEWGNPKIQEDAKTILSYSPYENVAAKPYPWILATAGINDPRVGFWEPAKWIKKIQSLSTSKNPALLKTDLDSGHAGPSGRYNQIKEQAFYLAFILYSHGILK